ncbi:hypothetical protein BJ508DRAFT_418752 [Ascobolus immersus RN42]|uniref:Uncharacterized protein n=1 Tax=Ascobolus immersus RN42 TaxID=1160509 RepID=A0A3N4HJS4_ASCIM|nr:hypothetical protein BJ508DRAFT_418752 [Ascobolus immersus RN42]
MALLPHHAFQLPGPSTHHPLHPRIERIAPNYDPDLCLNHGQITGVPCFGKPNHCVAADFFTFSMTNFPTCTPRPHKIAEANLPEDGFLTTCTIGYCEETSKDYYDITERCIPSLAAWVDTFNFTRPVAFGGKENCRELCEMVFDGRAEKKELECNVEACEDWEGKRGDNLLFVKEGMEKIKRGICEPYGWTEKLFEFEKKSKELEEEDKKKKEEEDKKKKEAEEKKKKEAEEKEEKKKDDATKPEEDSATKEESPEKQDSTGEEPDSSGDKATISTQESTAGGAFGVRKGAVVLALVALLFSSLS